MSLIWTTRSPGDVASPLSDDPEVLVIGAGGVGDYVRCPEEIGGEVLRIVEVATAECPLSGHDHAVRRMALAGPRGLLMYECPAAGFLWCAPKSRAI